MEASKVTISPETREAARKVLNRTERQTMKREMVLAHLRKVPAGKTINVRRMAAQLGLGQTEQQTFPQFLKAMVRDELITMDGLKGSEYRRFSVLADVKTRPAPEAKIVERKEEVPQQTQTTLGDYAKEFAWIKASDSLREFVKWMDGKELDLRRQIEGGGF